MTALTDIQRSALLSSEVVPVYRYRLARVWDNTLPVMVWIMLNPSTADHTVDDPTILACMDFARRNGFGGITVINLFAFRSPHPKVMRAAVDPVGPDNDGHLDYVFEEISEYGGMIVAAWGANGDYQGRAQKVVEMVEQHGNTLMCFGVTKDGHPKHPLARGLHRIPRDTPPQPYVRP